MGKTLAQQFLTPEDQERVRTAVHQAEGRTSGEIVPMIVSASHTYPSAAVLGGALIGGMVALALTAVVEHFLWLGVNQLWVFFLLLFVCTPTTGMIISRSRKLKRYFLTENQMELEVRRSAFISFYAENLHKTKDDNGVLLYISLLERKAWILGDTKINEKIAPETWQHIVDKLTLGIREHQQATALCTAIEEVARLLAEHFPWQKDDSDELKNLIIDKGTHEFHDLVIR